MSNKLLRHISSKPKNQIPLGYQFDLRCIIIIIHVVIIILILLLLLLLLIIIITKHVVQ